MRLSCGCHGNGEPINTCIGSSSVLLSLLPLSNASFQIDSPRTSLRPRLCLQGIPMEILFSRKNVASVIGPLCIMHFPDARHNLRIKFERQCLAQIIA